MMLRKDDTSATIRFRQALSRPEAQLTASIAAALGLSSEVRYGLAILRTSLRSKDVLARQTDTGLHVYEDLEDFQALKTVGPPHEQEGWLACRRSDLDSNAGDSVVGYVGLVGRTIFLAVHDSAVEGTLPPFPGDSARLPRNAFTELAIAVALAGQISDFYAPSIDRWLRSHEHGYRLQAAIRRNIPEVRFWENGQVVDLSAQGDVVMAVRGSSAVSSVASNKEAALEKALNALGAGNWPRASHELPLGLSRIPHGRGFLQEIELVEHEAAAVRTLLREFGLGVPYPDLASRAAELCVRVPGPKGGSRTFAELTKKQRVASIRALLRNERSLAYWQHGWWVQRLYTSLTIDRVKGHNLQFDSERRMRYADTRFEAPYPDDAFGVVDDDWKRIWARLDDEAARRRRSRERGAANSRRPASSAFVGVARWVATIGSREQEHLFAPETPTAYRLRLREPEVRGAGRREGVIVGTFRRIPFERSAGEGLLRRLREIADPIAPHTVELSYDPSHELNAELDGARLVAKDARAAADRWDRAFESETDPDEQEHARTKARHHRARVRAALETVARLEEELSLQQPPDETVEETATITLPALVADALATSDGMVEPAVRKGLRLLDVLDSMRAVPDDRNDPQSWWTFTATAQIDLASGEKLPVEFSWRIASSHKTTGNAALRSMAVRRWASGKTIQDVAEHLGTTEGGVRALLNSQLAKAGVRHRGLRSAALACPIVETRQVLGAMMLDDPGLAAHSPHRWRSHVASVYCVEGPLTDGRWGSWWCRPNLGERRRIIAELEVAGPNGIDIDALARRADTTPARVRQDIRKANIAVSTGRLVRLRRCGHDRCNGVLARHLPTPETGRNGMICTTCYRTDAGVAAPADYLLPWTTEGTETFLGVAPTAIGRVQPDERRVAIGEASQLLGLQPWVLRGLADAGEVPSVRGSGPRGGGRLFVLRHLRAIPESQLRIWRSRTPHSQHGATKVTVAEAAARLGVAEHHIATLVRGGVINWERVDGRRVLEVAELDGVADDDLLGLDGDHVLIGEVAKHAGLHQTVVRHLTDEGKIRSVRHRSGTRYYKLQEAIADIEGLGIRPGDDLILIGQAARILGESTHWVRRKSDEGEIPVACVINGTRRYNRSTIESIGRSRASLQEAGEQSGDEGLPTRPGGVERQEPLQDLQSG